MNKLLFSVKKSFFGFMLVIINGLTIILSLLFWRYCCGVFTSVFWSWTLFILIGSWIVMIPYGIAIIFLTWITKNLVRNQELRFAMMEEIPVINALSCFTAYVTIWAGPFSQGVLYPITFKILASIFLSLIFWQGFKSK